MKQTESSIDEIIDKERREFNVSSMVLNPHELVENFEEDSITLSSILNGEKKLFLVISDDVCGNCVDNSLNLLRNSTSKLETDKIVILGNYQNKRELFLLSQKYPFQYFLLQENTMFKNAIRNSPILFILDLNCMVHSVCYPLLKFPAITNDYIKLFLKSN